MSILRVADRRLFTGLILVALIFVGTAVAQVTEVTADGVTASEQVTEVTAGGVTAPAQASAATLEEVLATNKKILERQAEMLKQLEALKEQARQTRIFSARS